MSELNVDRLSDEEIHARYTTYLLQDISVMFADYGGEVDSHHRDEISRRVEYLLDNYYRIVGAVFGIRFTIKHKRLDIFLYPMK
jgi:hypothetical protein